MQEAYQLLQRANSLDHYESLCKRCPLNNKARANTSYTPWHDQTEARSIEELLGQKAKVILMNPTADGGMPHTRAPNLICIPANYPKEKLTPLLLHEVVHIQQRQNLEQWKKRLLEEGWMPDSSVPEEIAARCRMNPDTLVCRWPSWEGRWIACPVFIREDKPSLRDIEIRWWDLKEERLVSWPPSSYVKRYGSNVGQSAMEHPFELWAYKEEGR